MSPSRANAKRPGTKLRLSNAGPVYAAELVITAWMQSGKAVLTVELHQNSPLFDRPPGRDVDGPDLSRR